MINKMIKKFKAIDPALKASLAYTICSILQKALSLITMPLFTRLLTPEQYGQFSIYSSWQAVLSIILTLNLAYGSFNNSMMKFKDDRMGYISSIQSLVILLIIIFLGCYIPFRDFFNKLLALPTSIVLLLVAEVFFQFTISCWYGLKRYEFKYKWVVIFSLLITILSPIVAIFLVLNTQEKGYARIVGYAVVVIFFGLGICIYNFAKGKKCFSKKYWSYALRFNLLLTVYYLSQVIFNQSDKIMIEKIQGLTESGIYSVAYSLALLLTFVLNAINNSYVPWLYEKIKDGKYKDNRKMSIIITIIMCVLVGGVIWITPELVYIMAGKEYMSAIWVVPPVAISLILLLFVQYMINIEFYYESKIKLVFASLGAAVVNIGLNWWLIPIYGFVVAGYTTLISYVIFFICNYFAVHKKICKKGDLYGIYNIPVLLLIFGGFVVLSYVGVLLYNYMWIRFGIIVLVIIILLVFSKRILLLVNSFKSTDDGEKVKVEKDD